MALQHISIHLDDEERMVARATSIEIGADADLFLGNSDEAVAENALRLIEAAQAIRESALRRLLVPGVPDAIDEAKRAREIAEARA